ncbi:MAG: stage III sporulation AC/AD family protein [Clostridia bacterium]|nr:stage III sporulation AC/AD family protein [Clostridia bacterium]
MIKVFAVSVASVILIQLIKTYRSDYVPIIKLCAIVLIGFVIINQLNNDVFVFSFLSDIDINAVSYFPIILKTLGIVIVTQIASNICHDSGEEALSTVTELVGKIFILISCIPIIEALYTIVKGYLDF